MCDLGHPSCFERSFALNPLRHVEAQMTRSISRAHTSTQNPQVTLAITPVMALAWSDTIMTAASATSDNIGRR